MRIPALPESMHIRKENDAGVASNRCLRTIEGTIPTLINIGTFEHHLSPTVEDAHGIIMNIQTGDPEDIIHIISIRCKSIGNVESIIRADKDGIYDRITAAQVAENGKPDLKMTGIGVLVMKVGNEIGRTIAGFPVPFHHIASRTVKELNQRAELGRQFWGIGKFCHRNRIDMYKVDGSVLAGTSIRIGNQQLHIVFTRLGVSKDRVWHCGFPAITKFPAEGSTRLHIAGIMCEAHCEWRAAFCIQG